MPISFFSRLSANERGILAFVVCCAFFTTNDTIMKFIILTYPVGETIFFRGSLAVVILAMAMVVFRQHGGLRKTLQGLVLVRAGLDAVSSAIAIFALRRIGVAEFATIMLTAPLIITVMAVVFYKEYVGWRRWLAICVGFAGTLFILRPAGGAFNAWAFVALLVAVIASTRDLITRSIDRTVSVFGISLIGSAGLAVIGFISGYWETWMRPTPQAFALVLVAATFHAAGTYLLVLAFRGVTVSAVSPFRYTMLLWASIGGYLVFNDIPSPSFVVGAALIVGSGLYILHREAVMRRGILGKAAPAGDL